MIAYYLVLFLFLFIIGFMYIYLARKYMIQDRPNKRSSHKSDTVRGGGIVFPLALVCYLIFFDRWQVFPVLPLLLLSLISLWDDLRNITRIYRISVHFLAIIILLIDLNLLTEFNLFVLIITAIVSVGALNAYNFMDGINGMTVSYGIVFFITILYLDQAVVSFTNAHLLNTIIVALLVFGFFNFRKNAVCFAGDIGSIVIGFLTIYLLIALIMKTGDLRYILFLSVYGVDSVITIVYRLIRRQNIFEAHRTHLYQVLVNEYNFAHLPIAALYGLCQLIINFFVIRYLTYPFMVTFIIVILPLSVVYLITRKRLEMLIGQKSGHHD